MNLLGAASLLSGSRGVFSSMEVAGNVSVGGTLAVSGAATLSHNVTLGHANPTFQVGSGFGGPTFALCKAADRVAAFLDLRVGGSASADRRWYGRSSATTHSLEWLRYNASGGLVDIPLALDWATGRTTVLDLTASSLTTSGTLTLSSASPDISQGNGTGAPRWVSAKADASNFDFLDVRSGGTGTANRKWIGRIAATTQLYGLHRYNASGAFLDTPFSIDHGTGRTTVLDLTASSLTLPSGTVPDANANAAQLLVGAAALSGSENRGITIRAGVSGASRICFGDADSTNDGEFSYLHTTRAFFWRAAGGTELNLTSAALHPQSSGGLDLGLSGTPFGAAYVESLTALGGTFSSTTVTDAHPSAGQILVGAGGLTGAQVRGITIRGGNTGSARLYFGNGTDALRGGFAYLNNTDLLYVIAGVADVAAFSSAALYPIGSKTLGLTGARWSTVYSGALDVSGNATLGGTLKLGTYTTAARPAAGTAGRTIFNSDTGRPNYDTGAAWVHADGTAA